MKIYNNTNITYSAIEHNSRKNTKQNVPADLEKKMTQYTDTLSISKTGQESFRHLSSVSSMDYQNRFEKEVTDIFHTGMLVAFQGEQYILTDSRYTEQVELEAPEFTCVDIGREGYSKTIAAMVQKAFAKEGRSTLRIGFENKEISYMQYQAFVDTFAKELTGMQVEFVPLEDAVNVYREVKTEDEIAKHCLWRLSLHQNFCFLTNTLRHLTLRPQKRS